LIVGSGYVWCANVPDTMQGIERLQTKTHCPGAQCEATLFPNDLGT